MSNQRPQSEDDHQKQARVVLQMRLDPAEKQALAVRAQRESLKRRTLVTMKDVLLEPQYKNGEFSRLVHEFRSNQHESAS